MAVEIETKISLGDKIGFTLLAIFVLTVSYFIFDFFYESEEEFIESLGKWEYSDRYIVRPIDAARAMGISLDEYRRNFGDGVKEKDMHYDEGLSLLTISHSSEYDDSAKHPGYDETAEDLDTDYVLSLSSSFVDRPFRIKVSPSLSQDIKSDFDNAICVSHACYVPIGLDSISELSEDPYFEISLVGSGDSTDIEIPTKGLKENFLNHVYIENN